MYQLVIFEILLWAGAFLLLFGYISDYRKHHFRIAGYLLLGIFWVGEAPHYFEIGDNFNAILVIIALPLFAYFAYHESLSKKWAEDPEVMRFLAGGISIATIIYFGVQRIPIIAGGLIWIVTEHTVILSNLIGYEFGVGETYYAGNPLFYRTNYEDILVSIDGTSINIILACTGLQAMAPGFSLVYCTSAKLKAKLLSIFIIIPSIYVANLGRNVMIIYLTVEDIVSFDVAHNEIAKTGSVIFLIILLIIVFELMPKFHDNIMSVITLPKREPNHQKQQE